MVPAYSHSIGEDSTAGSSSSVVQLAVGRYWSDLIGQDAHDRWFSWASNVANADGTTRVRITATSHHDADGDTPQRDWILWEVLSPVMYDTAFYAPANVADDSIQSEEDTVSKPDPEPNPEDKLANWYDSLLDGGYTVGFGVGVGVLGLIALLAFAGKKRR